MTTYNHMNQNGPKIMRIAATITLLIISIILIAAILINYFLLHWLTLMQISIGLAIFFSVYIVIFIVVNPWLKYKNFRYSLEADVIYIRTGIIFVSTQEIPLFRIQNIDITEGFLMQFYDLATVKLFTAGGFPSVELINKAEAQRLKQMIRQQKAEQSDEDNIDNENNDIE